jgi:hypothetical protein
MKMNTQLMGAAIALALATSSAQANINLVVNGGFETGDFTGWMQVGNTGYNSVSPTDPNSGEYAAWFGADKSLSGIQQNVATTAGVTYIFEFYLKTQNIDPTLHAEAHALWNGSPVLTLIDPGDFGYTHYQYTVTATSALTPFEFDFRNDASYFQLDDVSVTAVPESSTWLAGAGASLAMLGSFVRRNRK